MKINVGDLVKVVGNRACHGFEIGEIVRVTDACEHGVDSCKHLDGSDWWMVGWYDVEPVTEGDQV
ncbi:hypothetical protein SAMN05518847_102421 [Paenibacillus sp. OV219]|nr:hypothetical protein SAMN05518847_102421 [Paenibacillus sp. OV219]